MNQPTRPDSYNRTVAVDSPRRARRARRDQGVRALELVIRGTARPPCLSSRGAVATRDLVCGPRGQPRASHARSLAGSLGMTKELSLGMTTGLPLEFKGSAPLIPPTEHPE